MNWVIYPINAIGRSLSSMKKDPFNSGQPELDRYLKQYASKNDVTGVAKTFVALPTEGTQVIGGYYSCNATGIKPEQLPADLQDRLPGYLTPAILIGKLAVDRSMQGRGLGKRLLRHALVNIIEVSEKIGVYAVRVDAVDEEAKSFYTQFGFRESQEIPLSLFLPLAAIKEAVSIWQSGETP